MDQHTTNQAFPGRRAYVSDEQEGAENQENNGHRPMSSYQAYVPIPQAATNQTIPGHRVYVPTHQTATNQTFPSHRAYVQIPQGGRGQTFPSRRAYVSDEQEDEASTSTRPIMPDYDLDDHLNPSRRPFSDVLGLDSEALVFLGTELLHSIVQAGRDLPVGTTANGAARASATSRFPETHGTVSGIANPGDIFSSFGGYSINAPNPGISAHGPAGDPPARASGASARSSARGPSARTSSPSARSSARDSSAAQLSGRAALQPPRQAPTRLARTSPLRGAYSNLSRAAADGTSYPPGGNHDNLSSANEEGASSSFRGLNDNVSRTIYSRGTSSFFRDTDGGTSYGRGLNNNSSSNTHPGGESFFTENKTTSNNVHAVGRLSSSQAIALVPNHHSDHTTVVAPDFGRGAHPARDGRRQTSPAPGLAGAASNTSNVAAPIRAGATNTSIIAAPILAGTSSTNRIAAPMLAGAASTCMIAAPNSSTATMSTEYQGDPSIVENYSAPIPQERSTSLFIKYLPPDTTVARILAHIHSTGKIWSLHVNPPTPPHSHSAAKICFFTRAAAAKFYLDALPGFFVDGYRTTVLWNRVLVPEHVGPQWDDASRVVIVRGPRDVVNMRAVADIVHAEIRFYDLVRVFEEDDAKVEGWTEVEVHFGSFRAQAHSAYIVLNRAFRGRGVEISYGIDPCA